ncbi:MAG: 3-deoxy-8-phosphooctulonate synthase [Deltaproteobacteria bacterium]|nr:3-deoxy-8-phosphooctulonate synthase [Deltaproteobacteria bacterium]MBW2121789.1 3-deoxy-8-phosphooctulonate synthase [Deltaproteobacteria bacterium]
MTLIDPVALVEVSGIPCGRIHLFLISGPCVIEGPEVMKRTAETLGRIGARLGVPVIFKSSFQKDNRSSAEYYRGPGLDEGLRILDQIRSEFGLPVMSDVHHLGQVAAAGQVLDLIQIPAYLCMQTDLAEAVARTGKAVNIKRGQFLAPENISKPVKKIERMGNRRILVTERGYTFGYNDLIVDPRSFHIMRQAGYPVVFDVTHAVRRYGIPSSDPRGGSREYLPVLGRAGVAAGVDGLFIECHPNPPEARCDASSQMYLDDLEEYLKPLLEINAIVKEG